MTFIFYYLFIADFKKGEVVEIPVSSYAMNELITTLLIT
jgi:hypothetical protein